MPVNFGLNRGLESKHFGAYVYDSLKQNLWHRFSILAAQYLTFLLERAFYHQSAVLVKKAISSRTRKRSGLTREE